MNNWYTMDMNKTTGQGAVADETTGRTVAVVYDVKDAPLCAAAPEMAEALRELTEAASVMFCNLASLNERDRQLAADCYWDSTEKARAALEKAGVL